MNLWTRKSIERAQEPGYLDDLFETYKIEPGGPRSISPGIWDSIVTAYGNDDNEALIAAVLKLELLPIKDSYLAFLGTDHEAIGRNPKTVKRLAQRIRQMTLDEIKENCSAPKETNRQMGPQFRNWISSKGLGDSFRLIDTTDDFLSSSEDSILNVPDAAAGKFATDHLGYVQNKGLDFVAKINDGYIIGEAKFLTDDGGHQNAQFKDALALFKVSTHTSVKKIAILDGVLYINSKRKMYKEAESSTDPILSCLLLRDYLESLR